MDEGIDFLTKNSEHHSSQMLINKNNQRTDSVKFLLIDQKLKSLKKFRNFSLCNTFFASLWILMYNHCVVNAQGHHLESELQKVWIPCSVLWLFHAPVRMRVQTLLPRWFQFSQRFHSQKMRKQSSKLVDFDPEENYKNSIPCKFASSLPIAGSTSWSGRSALFPINIAATSKAKKLTLYFRYW